MGKLMTRGRSTQAKLEARGAAKAARSAAKSAVRGNTKRAKLEGQVAAAATKEAAKDAAVALKELSAAVIEQARDSDALARAQAKSAELTDLAKEKIHERGLDEKAVDLVERIRAADTTQQALETARRYSDEGLGLLGAWLASGRRADKLGVQPRKRRFPAWLAALLGLGVGYGAAVYMHGQQATRPLEERIRTALEADPRTAALSSLAINVSDGTVFVRGPGLPAGVDESTLREVIIRIPGVDDVDLQLSTT